MQVRRQRGMHDTSWAETHGVDDSALKEKGIVVKDLVFLLTQECNLRCKHCYIGNQLLNSGERFSREECFRILDHYGSSGLDRITLLGGEPLLHPDITDLILQVSKYRIKEKRMTSNAVSLGYLDLTRLKGNELNHISVSLDGITADVHERVRGPKTFERTLSTVRRLLNHGFEIHATFTVTGQNKHQVVDSVHFFKELGLREVNFHLVSMIGNAAGRPELYCSPREWMEIRSQLETIRDVSGIRLRIPLMFVSTEEYGRLIHENRYHPFQKQSYYSDAGQRIILYPNGRVYMSSDLAGTEYHIAVFANGKFTLNEAISELSFSLDDPANPDPSSALLGIDTEGLIRLSISYKEIIEL